MKRLTLILALVLCLVLCVFAFASCDKGGKKGSTTAADTAPAGTTAYTPDGTTAHVHTPASEYTIDEEATCAYAGSKSKHCTVCDQIIPETVEEIPQLDHTPDTEITVFDEPTCIDTGLQGYVCQVCGEPIADTFEEIPANPNAHKVEKWSATPTLLNPSVHATGECTVCHNPIEEDLKFEPTIEAFIASSGQYNTEKAYFSDVRGDKHFYPTDTDPDGRDLYVEFSILWNETIANLDASANCYMCGRFEQNHPLYYFSPVAGCQTSDAEVDGAFEWMGNFKTPISDDEVTTPVTMMSSSSNYADYPNIMGADEAHPEYGWHRVGIRYHLELTEGKSGADLTDYVGIATVYLDGKAIFKLSTGDLGMQGWECHLFTAKTDGEGNVTYSDTDYSVIPFQINRAKAKSGTTVYLALADISVTCGKGFVMPVEKVASPEAATLEVAEGVEIAAPVYFKLAEN